ncbi:MAG: hypothetical protein ACRELC_08225 [Gemmatimonadota bacterium]
MGRSHSLRYASLRHTLLTINLDTRGVIEFDTAGNHIRTFDATKMPPSDRVFISAFRVRGPDLLALDRGNGRLIKFAREASDVLEVYEARGPYQDFTWTGPDEVSLVPGRGDALVEVLSLTNGEIVERVGTRGAVPSSCAGQCFIETTASGDLILIVSELPAVYRVAASGRLRTLTTFADVSILDRWREEEAELMRGHSSAGKMWITDVGIAHMPRVLLSVLPAHVVERSTEIWQVSLESGSTRRMQLPRGIPPWGVAQVGAAVYVTNSIDGAVYRADVPSLQERRQW